MPKRKLFDYTNTSTRNNKGRKLDRNLDSDTNNILLRISSLEEMVRKLLVGNEYLQMEVDKLKRQDNEYFNSYIS